jgi:hypothetical protein
MDEGVPESQPSWFLMKKREMGQRKQEAFLSFTTRWKSSWLTLGMRDMTAKRSLSRMRARAWTFIPSSKHLYNTAHFILLILLLPRVLARHLSLINVWESGISDQVVVRLLEVLHYILPTLEYIKDGSYKRTRGRDQGESASESPAVQCSVGSQNPCCFVVFLCMSICSLCAV